ncbi:hypothetical protein [Rhodoferax bucti]|uniref:hypothetical protein n=1 Tax=Rhodoferax bucti TaxID=2576305 RepID=UPI001108FD3A|nr:hypothetical protein [Rhodoferax bucti]
MAITVWVKVVGFSDAERHSLNTIFRVSRPDGPNYVLWTPDDAASPNVAVIDVDSYEAGLDLVSPGFNPHLKMIAVGDSAPLGAWRAVQRPVDWAGMVQMLDELFASHPEVDIDLFADTSPAALTSPPGLRTALLVGIPLESAYYLRARLSLAGVLLVDEVQTLAQCSDKLAARDYALAVVYVDPATQDPWRHAKYLQDLPSPPDTVLGVMPAPDFRAQRLSESMGCAALLEVPFNPQQVIAALQRV